jgi:RNA polymerase sigma factor (sigma-70 family)
LFMNVVLYQRESDRLELERRFSEYYLEKRFLGWVRKHIHYEALHLLGKCRHRQQQEALLLNMRVGREEGGLERIELLEDAGGSVEAKVVEETLCLSNLTEDRRLHEAIQRLTHKQQTVLYLLYVQQLTEGEAAERLGVSQQAINKVKQAALAVLREQLGQWSMKAVRA